VNEATRLVLQEPNALSVIEVGYCGDKARYALGCVLVNVGLEKPLLDPVVQPLIGEVDAEVIEGVRSTRHVLWSREIEETDERSEVVTAQALVDMLIQPSEE
jgi:hypothetical protein